MKKLLFVALFISALMVSACSVTEGTPVPARTVVAPQTVVVVQTVVVQPTSAPTTQAPQATGTPTSTQVPVTNRRETGQNASLHFNPGESAFGWKIVLDDGRVCDGGNCVLRNAPTGGTVTSGVINPWDTEIVGKPDSNFGAPNVSGVQTPVSVNPLYGQPPQPYIPHPSFYQETGIQKTRTWSVPVDSDKVMIVGGYTVDGQGGGVYKAYTGGQTVNVTITDGFVSVVLAKWGNNEWCFRIAQAVQYGWAHGTELPLAGWVCPAPSQ